VQKKSFGFSPEKAGYEQKRLPVPGPLLPGPRAKVAESWGGHEHVVVHAVVLVVLLLLVVELLVEVLVDVLVEELLVEVLDEELDVGLVVVVVEELLVEVVPLTQAVAVAKLDAAGQPLLQA
jgi:hypothetical protein